MVRLAGFGLVCALLALAVPAAADVKAGVDAWTRGDFPKAVAEWRGPAVAGDADAQFNLGKAYLFGRGVPMDRKTAREWFFKAASQGHELAQEEYGIALFQDGQKTEAAPWLEKAAARDRPRAELLLGTMLFNGEGVGRDYPRAYALMTRASQQGLKSASETLTQMDPLISSGDKAKGLAMAQTYAIAVSTGNAPAGPQSTERREVAIAERHDEHGPREKVQAPRPAPVRTAPRPEPESRPEPKPERHVAGGWRVQLGAFREAGNAHDLWRRVGGRLGGAQASFVRAGGITRLQAGPFASREEAQRACSAVGSGCVVVAR